MALVEMAGVVEHHGYLYGFRLVAYAYLLILVAVIDKDRR